MEKLTDSLFKLRGSGVTVSYVDVPSQFGTAAMKLLFSEGTWLRTDHWRLTRTGSEVVSSFDHKQKFGLPGPIDAINELTRALADKTVTKAQLDRGTGNLLFRFSEDINLQIFGFSAYEVWEIRFPDGTGEYSNFAKQP